MSHTALLVPVSDSEKLRDTVAYAVEEAVEAADTGATVHFVTPVSRQIRRGDETEDESALLDRVAVWAEDDIGDRDADVTIETAVVGKREYLFSPNDYARVIGAYARDNEVGRIVLDPTYNPTGTTPLLPPLAAEFRRAGFEVEEAPVDRPTRRPPLVRRTGGGQFALLTGLCFGFYLLIGGSLKQFDLVTGGISALIVAAVLWRVSLTDPVDPGRLLARVGRMLLYTPYLIWEILVANLQVAYVVLHPDLPIDPEIVEFDAAVWSELPVATLANSITLTPGTLTVDVNRQAFSVHTLTASARSDLLDGGLERAVRFVFYGRSAARIASPRERGAEREGDE